MRADKKRPNRYADLIHKYDLTKFANQKEAEKPVVNSGHYSLKRIPFSLRPYDKNFPHEFQESTYGCGAAALTMVYKSLGLKVTQKEVLERVVFTVDQDTGEQSCSTHRMVLDSLLRRFETLHVRAINPIDMLKACQKHSVRAVTHERAGPNRLVGHATAFLGIDDHFVWQHCSALGPFRPIRHNDLLEVMAPLGVSDIGWGNWITLISNPFVVKRSCKLCGIEIPEWVTCPECKKSFELKPSAPLGCFQEDCSGRAWLDISCPYCFKGIRKIKDLQQEREEKYSQEEWDKQRKQRQQEIEDRKNRVNRYDHLLPKDDVSQGNKLSLMPKKET